MISYALQGFLDGDSREILESIFQSWYINNFYGKGDVGIYEEKSVCGEAILDISYEEEINSFVAKIYMTEERANKQVPMVNLPQFRGLKKSEQEVA